MLYNRIDNDLHKEYNIQKRKSINIIDILHQRESGYYNRYKGETESNQLKRVYFTIHPNFTVINVKTPNCFLRKFSPDGKYLIAFNHNLCGINIFKFKGSSSAIDRLSKLHNYKYLDKTDLNNPDCDRLRLNIFDLFFQEIKNLKLTNSASEFINRECSLFYDNNYLIVSSSEMVNDDQLPAYEQIAQNNESIHVNPIESYTIYLVNLNKTRLCDKLQFKYDKIVLTHNQGLGLYRNVFSVLSQQNQTIYIYHIVDHLFNESNEDDTFVRNDKVFVLMYKIGQFCLPDDSEFIQRTLNPIKKAKYRHATTASATTTTTPTSSQTSYSQRSSIISASNQQRQQKGFTEPFFTSLKQRILTFFYREFKENGLSSQFYTHVNTITNLKMYRMQLLDHRHVLIKYAHVDYIMNQKNPQSASTTAGSVQNLPTSSNQTTSSQSATSSTASNEQSMPFFFVLYDIQTSTILNIFRNTSTCLFNAYENYQDFFTLTTLDCDTLNNYHTLASNNIYAKETLQRHIKNISKFNNETEMIKCLLTQLPISSQSYTNTPYLDHSLFSYDEKFISNFERPKPIGDQVIKFNNRETGRLTFKLYPGSANYTNATHTQPPPSQPQPPTYPSTQNIDNGVNPSQISVSTSQPTTSTMASSNITITTTTTTTNSNTKRLVAFIWHPFEPFCISVQRTTQEYNVNFHVYKK